MSGPSSRSSAAPAFLALSCVGFIASAPAYAADRPAESAKVHAADDQEKQLNRDEIVVNGKTVPATTLESPKATRSLLDTTQTVTIIGDQTIRKQNLLTLRDVLQTIPGITFGAGEGGGGYGDSINLRGYSANNDITIDGVRDSAQYSRSETFNLQQVEVYNGANSVFGGGGSVGGTINLITKRPQAETLTVVSGGVGTDDYYRTTLDSNVRVSDLVAVRLNAVAHKNDIPGRDVENNKRWAVAPSLIVGVEGPTSLTLQYLHQEDENVPVYGVPYFRNAVNNGPLPGADNSAYYGIRNLDKQDITVDQATATVSHSFSDKVSIRNLSRWQRVQQDSLTSAPQAPNPNGFCLSTGFQPIATSNVSTTPLACTPAQQLGSYIPSGPRGFVRNQENQIPLQPDRFPGGV
ncbi:TonB-dependent receptor [Sphingomonas sp. H160509]|uniref:TonB-dependent receptor n=1 Tax=Sphingomonas sp. H160509 TaxID=2955313 RepID=UPI003158E40D